MKTTRSSNLSRLSCRGSQKLLELRERYVRDALPWHAALSSDNLGQFLDEVQLVVVRHVLVRDAMQSHVHAHGRHCRGLDRFGHRCTLTSGSLRRIRRLLHMIEPGRLTPIA